MISDKIPRSPRSKLRSLSAVGSHRLKRIVSLGVVQPLSVINAFASDLKADAPMWETRSLGSNPDVEPAQLTDATKATSIRQSRRELVGSSATDSFQLKSSLRRGEVWFQALQTLSILLVNTLVCIAWAWLSNFCLSRGNIFTGTPVVKQTDFEFLSGTLASLHMTFYGVIVIVHVPVLWQAQFVSLQGGAVTDPARLVHIYSRLVRHTISVFVASALLNVATLFAVQHAPARARALHVEFYIVCLWIHLYLSAVTVAVQRIFLLETVQGQLRLRSSSSQPRSQSQAAHRAFSTRYFWKMYAYTFPKVCVIWLAGLYVQVMSRYSIQGLKEFVSFIGGSLVLKHSVKELAKCSVMRFNVKDPRSVFVVVGLPTVIIDTQMRIMVQKVQSTRFTLAWTLMMAVLEIATRVTKLFLTRRQIRLKQNRVADSVVPTVVELATPATICTATQQSLGAQPDPHTTRSGFVSWKRQILAFQIAESYANMSAEYIAIGCSTSILYFYWDHPKYSLGKDGNGSHDLDNASVLPWSHSSALGVQILVEIAVDYFSCVLEISGGIDFQQVRRYRVYLLLLFVSFAAMNVQISSVVFLTAG
ncbi:hypothetical protein Gpo141_00008648 [Globisporangium polare]